MIVLALLLPLLQAGGKDAEGLTVPVEVVRGPDSPVSGALVKVYSDEQLLTEAEVDASGRALLVLPIDSWQGGQRLVFYARAGDHVGLAGVDLRRAVLGRPVTLTLRPPVEAQVHTKPALPGQLVRLLAVYLDGGAIEGRVATERFEVSTDAKGIARFTLPRGASFRVRVTTSMGQVFEERGTTSEPVEVALPEQAEPAKLDILLTADDPAVISGRRLLVTLSGAQGYPRREVQLVTDQAGRATLDPCPESVSVSLLVAEGDPAYLPQQSLEQRGGFSFGGRSTRVEPGAQALLEVHLVHVGRGQGTVRAPGGLDAIGGVRLSVRYLGAVQEITASRDGGFSFLDARLGAGGRDAPVLSILAAPPEWRTMPTLPGSWPMMEWIVAPAAGLTFDIELARRRPVPGIVVGAEGAPVAKAYVRVHWKGPRGSHQAWMGVTDHEGRFEVPDLIAAEVTAHAEAPGLTAGEVTQSTSSLLRIQLRPATAAFLVVTLVDPTGQPWPGATLDLLDGMSEVWRGRTDAEGGRARPVAGDGERNYVLRWSGGSLLPESRRMITLDGGERILHVRPLGQLRGTVVDSNGAPVTGARVRHASNEIRVSTTGTDGRFVLEGVDLHRALVTVRAQGFRAGGTVAAPGADPVLVRLLRPDESGPPAVMPLDPLQDPDARRELARQLLATWTEETQDEYVSYGQVESWCAVDPGRARDLLVGFTWPNALIEARLFTLVDPGEFSDPRFELQRLLRAGEWDQVARAARAIDGEVQRLPHVMLSWWTARDAQQDRACRDLEGVAAELVAALAEQVAEELARPYLGTIAGSKRYWPAYDVVRAWLKSLAYDDMDAARKLVRGWRDMSFNKPSSGGRVADLPADADELRVAMERNHNLRQFDLLRRGISEGAWTRPELLELFDVAIRARQRRYHIPQALNVLSELARREPDLARELLWHILDRCAMSAPAWSAASNLGVSAHIALGAARVDADVGRALFLSEGRALTQELAGATRAYHELFHAIDWARIFAPDLLTALLGPDSDPGSIQLRRRAADALTVSIESVLETAPPAVLPWSPRQAIPRTQWLRYRGDTR